jgi:hypothetical protein
MFKLLKKVKIKSFNLISNKKYKKSYYFLLKKIYKKVSINNKYITNNKYFISKFKFLSKFTKLIYINNSILLLKYKKHYLLNVKYFLRKYKKLFYLKKILIKLKFINYKYNINNFLGLKNLLYKIYSK